MAPSAVLPSFDVADAPACSEPAPVRWVTVPLQPGNAVALIVVRAASLPHTAVFAGFAGPGS